jgi:hypothetical protein
VRKISFSRGKTFEKSASPYPQETFAVDPNEVLRKDRFSVEFATRHLPAFSPHGSAFSPGHFVKEEFDDEDMPDRTFSDQVPRTSVITVLFLLGP